jgi:hypothetical protein
MNPIRQTEPIFAGDLKARGNFTKLHAAGSHYFQRSHSRLVELFFSCIYYDVNISDLLAGLEKELVGQACRHVDDIPC